MEGGCLVNVIDKQVGVKEATGHNDGIQVEQYLKSTGNVRGQSWCAAFVHWCFLQCGITIPTNGMAASCQNKKNLVMFNRRMLKEPKPGDVLTLYSFTEKRIHHTGFYREYYNSKVYVSVEGNTSGNGVVPGSSSDVDGQGVYKKLRSYNATYSISRWVENIQ